MSYLEELKASKAIGAGNYDIAIDLYKKRLEEDESDQDALSRLAMYYEWKGDMESAIQYANKRLAHNPRDFHTLLLAARYWSKNGNEDQTYNYACRALENVPRAKPHDIPKVIYWLCKFLSIFKRFRGLYSEAKRSQSGYEKYYKENIEWARQYKEWYESKLRSHE
jgi:tetratricopeptide (TPR) repeat protein